MSTSKLTIGDTIIVKCSSLAVIVGRNIHDGTFLVAFIGPTDEDTYWGKADIVDCIPATKAAWLLYGVGPISNFERIINKGNLDEI